MYGKQVRINYMKNGLYCNAGKRWFSVGSEGRMYTCNALVYRDDLTGPFVGNILKDNIILRSEEFIRCPIQECRQVCDRHWSKKEIYENDVLVDQQNVVNIDSYQNLNNPISLLFAPTWKCNYSCKYCILPTKDKYPNIPDVCDVHTVDEWITAFTNFFDNNKIDGGIWHSNGGEPLYYDGIEKLFTFFYNRKFKIALTTNASADVYKKIVMAAPPEAFGLINCSCHPSDKNFRWELYKNRVELLKAMGYNIAVNFVGHPDQIMLAPTYHKWCQEIGVNFAFIPMVGGGVDGVVFNTVEDYPEPLRNIIKKYSSEILSDKNKFDHGKRIIK